MRMCIIQQISFKFNETSYLTSDMLDIISNEKQQSLTQTNRQIENYRSVESVVCKARFNEN